MDIKSALTAAFIQYVLPVLITAIAGGLGWVLVQLGLFIKAKWGESKIAMIAVRVEHLAEIVVADIEATLRPKIAAAAADGQLTAEEGADLKKTAMERLKAMLAERGLLELQGVLGIIAPQVDTYLSGAIEKAVAAKPAPSPS